MENYLAQGKKLVVSYSTSLQTNRSESQWQSILDDIASGTYLTTDPTNALTPQNIWTPEFSSENVMSVNGDFTNNSVSGTTEAKGGAVFNGMVVNNDDKYSVSVTKYVATRAQTGETITYWYGSAKNNIDYNVSKGKKLVVKNSTSEQPNRTESQWTTILNNIASGQYVTTDPENGLTPEDYWTEEYGGSTIALTGDFTNNSATATTGAAEGGAIYNAGIITLNNSNFTNNSVTSTSGTAQGGAIWNSSGATIGSIGTSSNPATFTGNYAKSTSGRAVGGAIYNAGTIGNIYGNFIGNKSISDNSYTNGGAIHLDGTSAKITNLEGNFINNSVSSKQEANGSAVFVQLGEITNIKGLFSGNNATSTDSWARSALWNNGTIRTVEADFINNTANGTGVMGAALGLNSGAIIDSVKGDFIGNVSTSTSGAAQGGAIFNDGTISSIIDSTFTNNSAGDSGGAIFNNGTISSIIDSTFTNNSASQGGAIYNTGTIGQIGSAGHNVLFKDNYAKATEGSAQGGAIYNTGTIGSITNATFEGNKAEGVGNDTYGGAGGGAIYNRGGTIAITNGLFNGNWAKTTGATGSQGSRGGAIANWNGNGTITLIDTDFTNNVVSSDNGNVFGAAIYNNGATTNIIAQNSDVVFENNRAGVDAQVTYDAEGNVTGATGGDLNDIENTASLNLKATDGKSITFGGRIGGAGTTNIGEISSDYTGTVNFNNIVQQNTINLNSGTMHLGMDDALHVTNFTVNGCTLDLITGAIETQNLGALTLNSNLKMAIDASLADAAGDKISASSLSGSGKLALQNVNLTSTSNDDIINVVVTQTDALKPIYGLHSDYILSGTLPTDFDYDVSLANGILTFKKVVGGIGDATLDTINTSSKNYLALEDSQHAKYSDLVATKDDDHPDIVVINGTTYYFKAQEADEDLTRDVRNLAATGADALKKVSETDNYIFKVDNGDSTYSYYTYDNTKLPLSVWKSNSTGASASSYNYLRTTVNPDNTYTNNYYNIDLKPAKMHTRGASTWTLAGTSAQDFTFDPATGKGSGTIEVKLPHTTVSGDTKDTTAETRYYTYNYTLPVNLVQSDRIGSLAGDVEDKYFYNISVGQWGAAISNESGDGYNIFADFILNNDSNNGGVIENKNSSSKLGIVRGSFIGNHAGGAGGVVYNGSGYIKELSGDFIANSANGAGGVLRNVQGTVDLISGNFIANTSGFYGGVISNNKATSVINTIVGNFINNKATNGGGAISNDGTIGTITGDFINNTAGNQNGGAIRLDKSKIGTIVGDFIGNKATSSSGGAIMLISGSAGTSSIDNIYGDFIGNWANYNGGAIYANGNIGNIVGNFTDNKAKNRGGAIYAESNIDSITGNFTGNVSAGSGGAISITNPQSPIPYNLF